MLAGWHRLWLLITALLVGYSIWQAFHEPNVMSQTGSAWYCTPGTYSTSLVEYRDGFIEPTDVMISVEAEKRGIDIKNDPMAELALRHSMQVERTKAVQVFSCSSYLSLIRAILVGLLQSLALAVAFLTIRWVWLGFRRT